MYFFSKLYKTAIAFYCILLLLISCNNNKFQQGPTDTTTSGTIKISVDESFESIIKEELYVFESQCPQAKVDASYKAEVDCFRDLFYDSTTRAIIVSRNLTRQEAEALEQQLQYRPQSTLLAWDAIVIIVNKENTDTLFTQERLRNQLLGKTHRNEVVVFDGKKATSTVRYIKDSILKGQNFDTTVVKAAPNTDGVIDYVMNHKNAVGLIGIDKIGNPEVKEQQDLLKKLTVCYVQCTACADSPFVKPTPATIASHRYPLVRGLYYILKENRNGLGSALGDFLRYETGQLIFYRDYLVPVMDFDNRNVKINTK